MSLSLIAAVGENRELGKEGGLCFRIPGDLRFFKKTTVGHPVFMGLTTWYSLPKKLPGREHYVAVFEETDLPEDIHEVLDIHAFGREWAEKEEELFVIGGASIYRQMLPYCTKLYLTEVHAGDPEADVFFPEFDRDSYRKTWLASGEDGGITYDHVLYERIREDMEEGAPRDECAEVSVLCDSVSGRAAFEEKEEEREE